MKQLLIFSISVLFVINCYCQTDTIYSNNEKIACSVKEITPDAIKYLLPEEELINTIYKNIVQKIVFKNGRVQTFAESTSLLKVSTLNDYENVSITQVEGEVKGLYKIGEISAGAKGWSMYSGSETVKKHAYKLIKTKAAMMGANIVYITYQKSERATYYSSYYGNSANTTLTGVAYNNIIPSFDEFAKIVNQKREFYSIETIIFSDNSGRIFKKEREHQLIINSIVNENGLIYINGTLQGESKCDRFRVVNFDSDCFYIFYEKRRTAVNIKIPFK